MAYAELSNLQRNCVLACPVLVKFDLWLGFLPNPFKANSTFTIIYEWLSLSLTQVASQLQGGSSTLLENTATGMIRHLIGTNINHRSAGTWCCCQPRWSRLAVVVQPFSATTTITATCWYDAGGLLTTALEVLRNIFVLVPCFKKCKGSGIRLEHHYN